MDSLQNYIGREVYSGGKPLGKIIEFYIDTVKKSVTGMECISVSGLFRQRFFVPRAGIVSLKQSGIIADKRFIKGKKSFNEEVSSFEACPQKRMSEVGNVYFDNESLKIISVSIKKGIVDDLIYGRDIVDVDKIIFTPNGKIRKISEE